MPARTGAELLRGLKDDRQLWVGDDRVTDVVSHPAFAGAAKGMAALWIPMSPTAPVPKSFHPRQVNGQ